jgi:predicted small secreted protein
MARARIIALLAAAAFVFAACSSARGGPDAKGGATGSASPSVASSSAAKATTNPLASGGSAALPSSKPGAKPEAAACPGHVQYSAVAGDPGSNYIRADTTIERTWGPSCTVLDPGDRCSVGWNAAYTVLAGDNAFIQFQAWAKGQTKPFKALTIGPLPTQNSFRNVGFPVTIPRVAQVAFQLVLLNDKKAPVAISDAYVYPVGCRLGHH